MVAAGSPGELAFASNDQSTPAAFVEGLTGGELQIEFKHRSRTRTGADAHSMEPAKKHNRHSHPSTVTAP